MTEGPHCNKIENVRAKLFKLKLREPKWNFDQTRGTNDVIYPRLWHCRRKFISLQNQKVHSIHYENISYAFVTYRSKQKTHKCLDGKVIYFCSRNLGKFSLFSPEQGILTKCIHFEAPGILETPIYFSQYCKHLFASVHTFCFGFWLQKPSQ